MVSCGPTRIAEACSFPKVPKLKAPSVVPLLETLTTKGSLPPAEVREKLPRPVSMVPCGEGAGERTNTWLVG